MANVFPGLTLEKVGSGMVVMQCSSAADAHSAPQFKRRLVSNGIHNDLVMIIYDAPTLDFAFITLEHFILCVTLDVLVATTIYMDVAI